MSTLNIAGAVLGNDLYDLLMAETITPGDLPSYQIAKIIYVAHPLGAKIAEFPIQMAQSQQRELSVQLGPKERLVEAFEQEWRALGCDAHILNIATMARVYGVASVGLLTNGTPPDRPIRFESLADADIAFNVWDPLNTAGSLVLNQDPNAMDFQKHQGVVIQGQAYHRSRTVTLMNEKPVYINYTTSAFGYVGRSVYQRALFPLKSYINSMVTDDLIALKAGVLVAKIKQQSSAIDQLMANIGAQKRALLQEAQTGNVLQIGNEDAIESLNLQNLDGAYGMARKNIIENIASAAGTPAKLLLSESYAEGFGEGTEDAKHVAQYIHRLREWMNPVYDFFTKITQYRAWNPEFFETLKVDFPEYRKLTYRQAFYDWTNSFEAQWPPLLEEPESDKVQVADVKLKAIIATAEVLLPLADPVNKGRIVQWLADNINEDKVMFKTPLIIDAEALGNYEPPTPEQEPRPAEPFSARDSMSIRRLAR